MVRLVMQRLYVRISDDSSGRVAGMVDDYRDSRIHDMTKGLTHMAKRHQILIHRA